MKNDFTPGSRGLWPKISVVTPSFNQGRYLEECIESVLSQNYPNLEYLILDGGSTDDSVQIIEKYQKHLTYWRSHRDGGQYSAINEGLQRSTGEIMTWLNSDDRFVPGAFEIAAIVFSEMPEVSWLTGRPNGFDAQGASPWMAEPLPSWSREQYLRKEYKKPYLQQEGTFWRRSLWGKAGGKVREDLLLAGDLELWVRFFRHSPLHVVDALLASFRSHADQKSTKALQKYCEEADQVLDAEIALFQQNPSRQLVPAPAPISTQFVYSRLAERYPSLAGLLRIHTQTEANLAETRELNRFLRKHWWTKLGRNLGLVKMPSKTNRRG